MKDRGFLFDWRVHVFCLILVVISEAIGIIPIKLGVVKFSLLPMLFALVLGIIFAKIGYKKYVSDEDMDFASQYVSICVMYLIAFMSCSIGPNLETVINAGPALLLQEFGNLGTIFLAMPIAILLFKMDRTAIGSAFSISREPSLAVIGNLYGLDGPEGRGVMGSYITGTLVGTVFCGIMSSLLLNVSWFSPECLAMACGTGSSSMMSASIAPIVERFPERADELMSYAATSQVLSSVDGTYMSVFLAIPISEWLYKKFKGKENYEKEKALVDSQRKIEEGTVEKENEVTFKTKFLNTIRILLISGVISMVAMAISYSKAGKDISFIDTLPGIIWMLIVIILAIIIDELLRKVKIKLPTILYIATISAIFSIPGFWPGAESFNTAMKSISLLPLCTPILAYAGISSARDVDAFLKQGLQIIVVTVAALLGTFIGSAVIANIVLKAIGAI